MLVLQFLVVLALGVETALSDYVTDVGYWRNLTCTSRYGAIQRNRILTGTSKTTSTISVTKSIRSKVNMIVTRPTKTRTSTVSTTITTTTTSKGADITSTVYTIESRWVTETSSVTSTVTQTVTSTNTVYQTTVVPTPDGFKAIRDDTAIVAGLKRPKKFRLQILKSNKVEVNPMQYIQRIECTHTIRAITTETVETTIQGRTLYPEPPTTRVTKTVTSVSTETEFAPGDVVATITMPQYVDIPTTVYPETTVTSTETGKQEWAESIPTEADASTLLVTVGRTVSVADFAACRANNFLNTGNHGQTIYALTSNYDYALTESATQEECCIKCGVDQGML
ncbi:hypothetical protein FSARC_13737 [Fusarium sarcochroum]|uniref:Uncharacterized protein n=1 Tax=Fusarium sarcochroum TaxID=1208366 RepID=A0A8H4WSP6_9HYPO|nr:hypothetical protein FSARC_13737 [Fusarium sarcochroum]